MTTPDLFDSEFQRDPYPHYRRLRDEAPVYREPRFGNYVLTRFDDVIDTVRDHATFRSEGGVALRGPSRAHALTSLDPPRHDRVRGLINRAFTPRRVDDSRKRIEDIAEGLLDAVRGHEFDLVAALSQPLPVVVIAEMLGVPPERGDEFKRWSDAITGVMEAPASPRGRVAIDEIVEFFRGETQDRRANPGPDLVTALVEAELDGQRLDDREVVGLCVQLLVAGNETTTNLIGNLVDILLDRPEVWERLRADRALVGPVVEETLRFESPVQNLARTTARPVTLHGVEIPEAARVMISFASANRDPAAFDDPDRFDLERRPTRHLAFGFGVHFCLGASLARLEARVALEALLDRFATLERVGVGRRLPSTIFRGFGELPVRAG